MEENKNIEENIITPTPISPIKEILSPNSENTQIPATEITPAIPTNSVNLLKTYLMLLVLRELIC